MDTTDEYQRCRPWPKNHLLRPTGWLGLDGRRLLARVPPASSGGGGGGGGDAAVAGRSVYVGNLTYEVVWQDLKDHMRAAGDVLHARVLTMHDGRSKGCGVVEYASADAASRAIAELHDSELMGRQIFVREDREESRSMVTAVGGGGGVVGGGGGERGGRGGGRDAAAAAAAAGRSVYVGNLAYEVAWQDLKDHMRAAGDVLHAKVLTMQDGRSKGCGVVEYASADAASRAIAELHDSELMGRQIFVREDRERGSNNGIVSRRTTVMDQVKRAEFYALNQR
ncbi:hypothetical protein ACHAW5_008874 [Stephanodiscus triporus]|uniref:RRM domain-containing protein n=1 Tax=Stephanodiscus triporus TaxID=2934178 RepID=A0ABD3NRR2_9STRA